MQFVENWNSQCVGMKVNCKVLSHIKLDQSYSLLSVRDVCVILELFKAMDVRGEMALDGRKLKFLESSVHTAAAVFLHRYPVLCVHA